MRGRAAISLQLLLAAFVVALAAPPATRAAEPLAAEWHFDAATTTASADTTPDSSGNGYDLSTCHACIQISSGGKFGNYLAPTNGHALQTTAGIRPQRVTLLTWYRKSNNNYQDEVVAGQGFNATGCGALSYALYAGTDAGDDLRFAIRQGGNLEISPDTTAASDGNWHLVAGVFDGSTVQLYVDGNSTGETVTPASTIDYGANGVFGAEGFQGGTSCAASPPFTGDLDELRVYDRALTGAEMAQLAAASGPTPPELPPDSPPQPPPSTTPQPPPSITPQQPPPTQPILPVASFTPPGGSVKLFRPALLNAGSTTGATSLLWDLNGDGRTDLVLPANRPVLAVRFPQPGRYDVRLTAVGAGGVLSSASHQLTITGANPPAGLRPMTSIAGAAASPVAGNLQVLCGAVGQIVTFGAAQARGCFNEVENLSNVPPLEQAIVRSHYVSSTAPAVVNSICNQAAAGRLPQSECDAARKEFGAGTEDADVSSGPVDLNGLEIKPVGPAHVVLYPAAERVISSFAVVTWGSIPVYAGPVDWDLDLQRREGNILHTGASGFAQLFDFDASKIGDIAGFHPTGDVALKLRRSGGSFSSEGAVNLGLPNEFSLLGGKAPTAGILVTASNDSPPVLDHLALSVPEVNLGALDMTDLSFRYERNGGIDGDTNPGTSCTRKEWKATGNIFLVGTANGPDGSNAGIKMTPPPSQNGVEFCAGNFKAAGADLVFGDAAPEVFPGVDLSDINFAMQLDPTLLRGGIGLDVVKLAHIDGTGLVVLASQTKQYFLSAADAGGQLAELAGRTFSAPTFAVGGDVYVRVPVYGLIKMGDGALEYSYPNYMFAGGEVRMTLPGFSLTGGLSGQADLATGKFEASAGVSLCLAGLNDACLGATGWVGTRGIAACLSGAGLHPGAGYRWQDHYLAIWLFDGCKPSRFWEPEFHPGTKRTARTAAGGVTVTLARGERFKDIELDGSGGAPSVTVHSPDGRTLDVVGHRLLSGHGLAGVRIEAENATFVGISGVPGRYVIEPLAGSAPITKMLTTRPGYDSNFTARVTGRGAHRTLIYDARRPQGQVVTFAERSRNVFHILGSSHGGRGRLRFTPAAGTGGRRQIIAMATLNGAPIPDQTLTSYVAPGLVRTGRPGRVRVRRSGTRLTVSWTRAAGAVRYAVVLRLADGSTRGVQVGGRRGVRLARVPLDFGGTVQVTAQGVMRDWGRPASVRFKRLRAPFTVQQTNRHNERLTYLRRHPPRRRRHR